MTHTNFHTDIIFPMIGKGCENQDRDIIQIFMQSFRIQNHSRGEVRVFQSIAETSDVTGFSDGVVAKTLVDHGLRASRNAFPIEFINHVDRGSLSSTSQLTNYFKTSYRDLKDFWCDSGESPFAFLQSIPDRAQIPSFLNV